MRTEHASGRACVVLSKTGGPAGAANGSSAGAERWGGRRRRDTETLRRGAAAIDLTEGVPAALTLLVGFSRAREERGADAGGAALRAPRLQVGGGVRRHPGSTTGLREHRAPRARGISESRLTRPETLCLWPFFSWLAACFN